MVQFTGQNSMAAAVPGQEDDFTALKPARQECIRGRAERGFDFHPSFARETFDVIQAAAANEADTVFGHGRSYTLPNCFSAA